MYYIFSIFFGILSIVLTLSAYYKHPELKKFKIGIIIAVASMSIAVAIMVYTMMIHS